MNSETKEKEKFLVCPHCKESSCLRVNVSQDVDVTINEKGEYENGYDFSDPDLDDDSGEVYCANCGNHLTLKYVGEDKYVLLPEMGTNV